MADIEARKSNAPFIHEIRVGWGDCDVAKIAYTARLPWFALEAIDAWWEYQTGGKGWYQLNLDNGIGTPFVHMEMDFRSPVTPRHRLLCQVEVTRMGETSIEFRVTGRQADVVCFEGRYVCVFVEAESFEKRRPPQPILDLIASQLQAGNGD